MCLCLDIGGQVSIHDIVENRPNFVINVQDTIKNIVKEQIFRNPYF